MRVLAFVSALLCVGCISTQALTSLGDIDIDITREFNYKDQEEADAIIDKATKQHEMQEAQSILKEELQNTIAEEIRSCIPQIVDAVTSSIQKNGIAVAAPASNYSPQNITDTQTINTTPKTEEAPPPISEEAMLALQLADMFGG